ncbi:MAG: hypothetical protein ACLQU1_38715 [Bryobacteraceae bacterium]
MPIKLTHEIITAAIEGYEAEKIRIDHQIGELRAILSGPAESPEPSNRKRKKFSAATRRRMRQAQRQRWAKVRGESEPHVPATPEPSKPKRKLSAAGRKAIVAATKRRWALKRAEAKKAAGK